MEVERLFNITKDELKQKKNHIFIGISIGNKWFNEENIGNYIEWALKNTKEKVIILIADKIQAINYGVRNKNSKSSNLNRAMRRGREIRKIVNKIISNLSDFDQSRIKVINWEEYEEKDEFNQYKKSVYDEFNINPSFKKEILKIVKDSIRDKEFSEKEYNIFSKYILEEFMTIYSGIMIDRVHYNLYPYPILLPVSNLINKIQKGESFSQLRVKPPKEKVKWAILR